MSTTKALDGMTPYEKMFGNNPQVQDLHVRKKRRNNLDMVADPGVFLGFAKTSLGYRILGLETGKLIERRAVVFYETIAADPTYLRDLIDKTYVGGEVELPNHIDFVSLPITQVDKFPVDGEVLLQDEMSAANDMEMDAGSEHHFFDQDIEMSDPVFEEETAIRTWQNVAVLIPTMIVKMIVTVTSVGVNRKL
ncbi:polyprotein [Phytophthora megakarya]|uniref:Polyprotein n=1 Tax=Phytophthora megakarya TaxID=4795 RepID=A0A225WJN5_9STRA|nr:polyprotein [Phytophthora megakarya]